MRLIIDGMSCQHCATRVQKAIQKIPGVSSVIINLKQGTAEVTTNGKVEAHELISAVADVGYEARVK